MPAASFAILEKKLLDYYPEVNLKLVKKAFQFASDKHRGQKRHSGEDYIIHPISVAIILAELRLDLDSIITGLLHDTVEDTEADLEEIESLFGPSISFLVDAVTKISRINFRTTEEKQAENFRKMIVAVAKDLRVILVKLADRTHNMQTLEHLPENKQRAIAEETLDIYAPLANRLGIEWMKVELEDLCLRYLKPEMYQKIETFMVNHKAKRDVYMEKVKSYIQEALEEYRIDAKFSGRLKHIYSIYKKMESNNIPPESINDIIAFRIVVDNITECYKSLGVIHSAFKPVAGRFKDYIAMPKPNNYQALHTTVIGSSGERLEIQICTHEMYEISRSGVAAHWKYKEGHSENKLHMDWLNRLMEAHQNLKDPNEFLESVRMNLYDVGVYVFTPKGQVKELVAGSTPIDFAYSVHTDVGHACTGAKVNGKMVSLRYNLCSGDTVSIITSKTQKPSKDWLKVVRSSKAMSKLRYYFKQEEREKAQEIGKEILDREFRRYKLTLERMLKSGEITKALPDLSCNNIESLYVKIGFGRIIGKEAVQKIIPAALIDEKTNETEREQSFFQKVLDSATKKSEARNAVTVDGVDNVLIRFGKCCSPIPGDSIFGFITRGRGVTVHTAKCAKGMEGNQDRKIYVEWNMKGADGAPRSFYRNVKIKVYCEDTPGLLAEMTKSISADNVNISQATVQTTKESQAVCIFEVMIKNVEQLNHLISSLERKAGIISVERIQT